MGGRTWMGWATVQVRDKWPTHMQNACTIFFGYTHVEKRVPTCGFDARVSFRYSLSWLCFLWHCFAQEKTKQKAVPTNWNFHISGSTSHKQLLIMGKHVVIGVLICNEIYFDVRDKNSACKRTWVMLFSTRHGTCELLFWWFCDVLSDESAWMRSFFV